jgi:CBS domain-containing protein
LSASDLRGLNKETLPLLDGPLVHFLSHVKRSNIKKINEGGIATRDYTVERAVRQMLSTRIHRVWIVDDNSVPIGCVSMSDVLAILVPGNLKIGLDVKEA